MDAAGTHDQSAPDGNHFPTQDELEALLARTGFRRLEQTSWPSDAPLSWSRRVERVTAVVAARHRAARAYGLAARQAKRFSHLFATKQISVELVHAVRPTAHC